jgi:Tc toxin complex TcA C-terminal TcB-binding domain
MSTERRSIETNRRELEIDQSFSLGQIDPPALLRLKESGECDFTLAEIFFDLAYPGHYRRRIRALRLTIPCVTGPFVNVSATLSLTRSQIRMAPALADDQVVEVPVSRPSSIATSNAQNDAGVFDLSFRDERYMPFEGAGAVASFHLELPKSFRPFDYQTIDDVIVRLNYTAEADRAFAQQIQAPDAATAGTLLNVLSTNSLGRAFSLRREFPTAFNRLVHSPAGTPVEVAIEEEQVPFFLHGRHLAVTKAVLAVRPREGQAVGAFEISIDGTPFAGFAPDPSFGGLPAVDVGALFANGLYRERELRVHAVGDLGPDAPVPGDPSALDEDKLLDVVLYVEYELA